MVLLTKDQIWQADDILFEDVPVPEWSPPGEVASVRLRGLSGAERDAVEAAMLTKGKGGAHQVNLRNARARLVIACAIDEAGQPLFTQGDLLHLGQKSATALERLFQVAQRLSGMSKDDVEELTGNSEPGLNGSSISV